MNTLQHSHHSSLVLRQLLDFLGLNTGAEGVGRLGAEEGQEID